MALAEQSPLDAALERIVAQPGVAQQAATELAPKSGVLAYIPGGFDWKSGTTAASGQATPYVEPAGTAITGTAPAAAAPAAAAPAASVVRNSAGLTQDEYAAAIGRSIARTPGVLEPEKMTAGAIAGQFSTPENWSKYYSLTGLTGDALTNMSNQAASTYKGGARMQQSSGAYSPYQLNIVPASTPMGETARTGTGARPVNPGPRAPWQASQQYWKDLEAYTKAGGK